MTDIYVEGPAARVMGVVPALGIRACFTTGDRYGITRIPVACWVTWQYSGGTIHVTAMLAWKSTKPIGIDDMPSEYSFVGYDQGG